MSLNLRKTILFNKTLNEMKWIEKQGIYVHVDYQLSLNLPAWIGKNIHYKIWYDISYPPPGPID